MLSAKCRCVSREKSELSDVQIMICGRSNLCFADDQFRATKESHRYLSMNMLRIILYCFWVRIMTVRSIHKKLLSHIVVYVKFWKILFPRELIGTWSNCSKRPCRCWDSTARSVWSWNVTPVYSRACPCVIVLIVVIVCDHISRQRSKVNVRLEPLQQCHSNLVSEHVWLS